MRRAYEAFTASDLAAFLAVCRDDIRLFPMLGGVEGGYAGHRGVRDWWAAWHESFDDIEALPEHLEHIGDVVLVTAVFRARGHASRADVAQKAFHAVRISGGRMSWFAAYRTRDEALEAIGGGAGVSVDH